MLDTVTKRRIDTARDILVGKVPDPKSQVEQITIALIYKFMDDMDAEAEELGGKRKFFTGDFARYGWAKLMSAGIGGHELIGLYGEGITTMPQNPGIPPLFRDIFKNAYLPYRDPETLKSFLKIIDEFSYDHSERLGDAYEYLLSVLGSQGDAGQFRTPRHIIDFMVEIMNPKKNETIIDTACGTAGFLISAYKHILKHNSRDYQLKQDYPADTEKGAPLELLTLESPLHYKGDLLTPEERKRLAENIKGYDISPDMVRMSLVNLYLHGFNDPHIFEYDTLTSEERWDEYADVIFANPPFMSPKGGIKPHKRFSIQAKRSEVLFVDYIAEHLTPAGRAAIIVPEGIIFQSQTAYKALRKMLVDRSLVAVISLPAGVFQPYSGVKTSILILDKSLAKQSGSIAFFKVENDGFGLGAQRRAIAGEQLTQVQEGIKAYFSEYSNMDLRDGQDKSGKLYQSGLEALVSQGTALIVPKEKIAANGDYNLSGERYREGVATTSAWPFVEIGDLCEVKGGKRLPQGEPFAIEKTAHPYLRVSDFRNATVDTSNLKYITEEIHNTISRYTISSVDVYITIAGTIGLMGTIPEYLEGANLTENAAKLVIVTERIDKRYLALIGNGILVQEQIASLTHAVGVPKLSLERIKTIRIPLPPLDVQKEIVAEIEDYQKVINGARAVLDNYRPHIHIHPDWPTVKLGAVISLEYGKPLKAEDRAEGDFPVFGSNGIVGYHNEFLVEAPAIIVGRKGSAGAVNFSKQPCYPIDTTFYVQIKHIHKLDLHFCYYQLCALELDKVNTQSGVPGLNRNDAYEKAFNLPPLATQQAIVAEIEAEQALVAANRELITRFEKKIQATLARVWGEELEHGCTD